MNTYKLITRFILGTYKIRKDGKAPIFCRITYLGKRKQFSTSLYLNPDYWKSKQQKAYPPDINNSYTNTQLSLISQKINKAFLYLQVNNDLFDVEDIYLQYKGVSVKTNKTILEVFETHNKRMKQLIGLDYAKSTYAKFLKAKNHASNFIKFQYKKNDLLLESITMSYLKDFDFYCKSELGHKQVTINKSIQRVRKIIKLALAEGYLQKDPFILYKPKSKVFKVVYLTTDELQLLEQYNFKQERLEFIKNLFVFCCYTGLPYRELMDLNHKHIITGFDGNKWIKIKRVKTSKYLSIPLLPKAENIIDLYNDKGLIFPRISNQRYNSYLKEIADIVGIDKNLATHIARKTFATTVLLFNDVPMEIVSELLGHSNITITQAHYGKIVQKKVSSEMKKLNKKLKK